MNQSQQVEAHVHRAASLNIRSVVLPRAKWQTQMTARGAAYMPEKGTWCAHVVRGRSAHDVVIVPMVSCPACGRLLFLSHTPETARELSKMHGQPVPVAHSVNYLGQVSPDCRCAFGGCSFLRKVVLDRWNKTKPLFAMAYINEALPVFRQRIEIAYSHSIDAREARNHLGPGRYRIIGAGRAIGFHVDEKTGKVTAD